MTTSLKLYGTTRLSRGFPSTNKAPPKGRFPTCVFPQSLGSEDLDGLAFGDGDHGLLPRAGVAGDVADALLLGLDVEGVDLLHRHAEDLLDRLGEIGRASCRERV